MTMTIGANRGIYGAHFERYVSLVPEGDLLATLEAQPAVGLFAGVTAGQADFRYAEGKWSVKEVLGHMIDTERVMAYRALRFGRNDPGELRGFDQDPYVMFGGFALRTLDDLLGEFRAVRASTLYFFRGLPQEAWDRCGVVGGHAISVLGLGCVIAGHELYHGRILREKYGLS